MDETRRGTKVIALTMLKHPTERITILPKMQGIVLHEISETTSQRHQIFIKWEAGGTFYAFEEEIKFI